MRVLPATASAIKTFYLVELFASYHQRLAARVLASSDDETILAIRDAILKENIDRLNPLLEGVVVSPSIRSRVVAIGRSMIPRRLSGPNLISFL